MRELRIREEVETRILFAGRRRRGRFPTGSNERSDRDGHVRANCTRQACMLRQRASLSLFSYVPFHTYVHTYVCRCVYIYIRLRIREWQMRYTTSSFLSLSDRLNPRPAFLFKVRAFGYGRRNGFRVVRRLNRSRFDRVQRNDVHCKFSIAMFRRYYFFGEFEFGAFDASSFFFTEGVCASVINDSSRIIYRPLIRGWIKASAIKLRNICAALPFPLSPPFSLSLYLPPRLHPLLRFVRNYEDGNNRRMGFFSGVGEE